MGLFCDVLALAGVGLTLLGLWRVHPPTAMIVAGLLLVAFGIFARPVKRDAA